MSIDLYSLPSTNSRRSDRATVFGDPLAGHSAQTIRQRKARKTNRVKAADAVVSKVDAGVVASLLSALVEMIEGRNLGSIIPKVPSLLNDRLGISPNGDFADSIATALYTVVTDAGRVVNAPEVDRQPHQRSLSASAIGVSPGTTIRRSTPRVKRKFDEFAAHFSDGVSLAAVLADGNDGVPVGFNEVMVGFFTAIRNAFLSGDPAAVAVAAGDLGSMLLALDQAVNGTGSAQRSVMRKVGHNHYVRRGYEPALKALTRIDTIKVGDDDVPADQVSFSGGKPIRKRMRSRNLA